MHMSNGRKHLSWLFRGFVGDKILANSFFGIIIIINQYKDPTKQPIILESRMGFFVAHLTNKRPRLCQASWKFPSVVGTLGAHEFVFETWKRRVVFPTQQRGVLCRTNTQQDWKLNMITCKRGISSSKVLSFSKIPSWEWSHIP